MPQTIVNADIFQFNATKGVQTGYVFSGDNLWFHSTGLTLADQATGTTVAGLEGSPDWGKWINVGNLSIGGQWRFALDGVLKPGCRFANVLLCAEADQGTVTVLCTLQSTPSTGTSDAWTDLATGSATIGSGQRYDVNFAPLNGGSPVYVHGALNSGGHFRYRVVWEITGMTGSPTKIGLYHGYTFLWSETDVWNLMGSATL